MKAPLSPQLSPSVAALEPAAVLRDIADQTAPATPAGERTCVADPLPMYAAPEARLTDEYWATEGLQPFVRDEMPWIINNSGFAAAAAARVLFDGLRRIEGPLRVLEVAAGSGLFARQVLDAMTRADTLGEVIPRLTWWVTDGSPATVADWSRCGQFDTHHAVVRLAVCDALTLELRTADGAALPPLEPMHVVLANYALDALPTTVVRTHDGQLEELRVSTWLQGSPDEVTARTGVPVDVLRAELLDPAQLGRWVSLVPELELEAAFVPAGSDITPWAARVADHVPDNIPASVNFGALDFLTAAAERLAPGGFLLVSDYGPTQVSEFVGLTFTHRFGHMATWSVNFPFLERYFDSEGFEVHVPRGDEHRSIHVRLIARADTPSTAWQTFLAEMGDPRYVNADRRHLVANEQVAQGQHEAALETFRGGLEYTPDDWYLLASAAQFLCQQLGHNEAALALAERAAALNPWHSAFVWNTLGNAYYRLSRFDEADQAFERAFAIDPQDPQTLMNRAFVFDRRGDAERALRTIADALMCDGTGRFRESLLAKQAMILQERSARYADSAARLQSRERALKRSVSAGADDSAP